MERILIIDDEPMNLKLTKFILDNAGYEVVTTESGISGIELLQEIPFDLLMLDIKCPRWTAWKSCGASGISPKSPKSKSSS